MPKRASRFRRKDEDKSGVTLPARQGSSGSSQQTSQSQRSPLAESVGTSLVTTPSTSQVKPAKAADLHQSALLTSPSTNLWNQAWSKFVQDEPELAAKFDDLVANNTAAPLSSSTVKDKTRLLAQFIDNQLGSIKQKEWRLRLGRTFSIGVRETIERVIGVITTIKDFATQAAGLDPLHAGLPVAALCLIVSLLSRDKEQAGLLSNGVELVTKLTQRYLAIEAAYIQGQHGETATAFRNLVRGLYQQILSFQVRAIIHLDANTARRTVQNIFSTSSWTDMTNAIEQADTDCEEYRRILDAMNSIQAQANSQKMNDLLQQFQNELLYEWRSYRRSQNEWYESEKASQCMRALRTVDYESYKNIIPTRADGTCRWLTEHEKFKDWLRSSSFSCLWTTADPGCGKSVLSRYLIDEYLPQNMGSKTKICYYFFKNEGVRSSATNALCSLLHQLFDTTEIDFLLEHIKRPWDANRDLLAGLFEELWRVFLSVTKDFCTGEVIVVIDALDECVPGDRKLFVQKLAQLCASTDRPSTLKILVTSRPDSLVEKQVLRSGKAVSFVRLMGEDPKEAEAIKTEIDVYIDSCVDRFKQLRSTELGETDDAHIEVREHVQSVPNRTYLWVALVFEEIEACSGYPLVHLREVLQKLPPDVERKYEDALQKVTDPKLARKLLNLVLVAREPLTPVQLFMALRVTETTAKMSELEPLSHEALCNYLRTVSGLFIVFAQPKVVKSSAIVIKDAQGRAIQFGQEVRAYFIHETAREFLTRPANASKLCASESGWKHSFDRKDACHEYAKACMLLLLLLKESSTLWKHLKHHEFVQDDDWTYKACFETLGIEKWAWSFFCPRACYSAFIKRPLSKNQRTPFTQLADTFREADQAAEPSVPLAYEICHLRSRLVYALLGFDENTVKSIKGSSSTTALFVAIALDLPILAPKFFQNRPDQLNEMKAGYDDTLIIFAIDHSDGWLRMLATNEHVGLSERLKTNPSILRHAAKSLKRTDTLEILLQIPGVDVNQRSPSTLDMTGGSTALMHASPSSACVLLEDQRVQVNLQDDEGNTALHYYCQRQGSAISALLKHNSVDANIFNREGATPLMTACQHDHEIATLSLVQCRKINVNTSAVDGASALNVACEYNNFDCVQALLQHKGLNVDSRDRLGSTALTNAWNFYSNVSGDTQDYVWDDLCQCVRLLLAHGADPSLMNDWGMAPATCMLVLGGRTIFDLFRSHNALPTALDDNFIPSLAAVWHAMNYVIKKDEWRYVGEMTLEELRYGDPPAPSSNGEVQVAPAGIVAKLFTETDEDKLTLDKTTRAGFIEPRFFDMMFDRYRAHFPAHASATEPVGYRQPRRVSSWPCLPVRRRPEFRIPATVKRRDG